MITHFVIAEQTMAIAAAAAIIDSAHHLFRSHLLLTIFCSFELDSYASES